MYLKTRTWAAIGFCCLIGAVCFWRLGVRQEKAATAANTNAVIPLLSVQMQGSTELASPEPTNTVAKASPKTVANTNTPFAYRLNNTTRKIDELVHSDSAVLLRNALVDSASGVALNIPPHLRSQGEPGSYVVQSRGPLNDAFREQLKAAGAEIVSYVPNNAYLVRASAAGAAYLRGLPDTRSVMPWEPYFKLAPKLLELAVEQKPLPDGNPLSVLAFPGDTQGIERQLRELGATVMRKERSPFGVQMLVHAPADKLVALAQMDLVQAIEPVYRRVIANDLARTTVAISTNTITANNHLDLTGQGVKVGVNDTGVDENHPDLDPRVMPDTPATGIDAIGHGTHVAGIIASSGVSGQNIGTNAAGSTNGASFRGMAPQAEIFAQPIDLISGPLKPDAVLQEVAATNGVFICNNSWGYFGAFDYTFASAVWDAAVRDSVPGMPGSQAQTYVFAAGNSGFGDSSGGGGFNDTISAPGTAKNVITVGALEQLRNITNEVVNSSGQTNTPFADDTDSNFQVAGFSSRGNTGIGVEGPAGRFKPDVVAPGVFVVSTRASNWVGNLLVNVAAGYLSGEVIPVGDTNIHFFFGAPNAYEARIRVIPNNRSPVPFPTNSIYVRRGSPPPPSDYAVNSNSLSFMPVANDIYYFGIGNNFNQDLHCDIQVILLTTNPPTPADMELANLNRKLEPHYRYESGTSMAAPVVSGVLALMQQRLGMVGITNPSPALMKALLINGAVSIGTYNLEAHDIDNFQGWGLVNITNSMPAYSGAVSQWPVRFFDQQTNGLVTGDSHTRIVTLNSNTAALRVSLVWTDPPGNPAVGVKLVNDLDLLVTNLNTGDVYVGNLIGGDFNVAIGTNDLVTDVVNNVENVYIPSPRANQRFSVTVRARHVNVNAVTAHNPNGIAQDYALVISTGNPGSAPVFTVDPVTTATDTTPPLTVLSNSVPVFSERIGANPNITPGTTNGLATQWRFFEFVDSGSTNTNVAFFAFLTPNLSRPRTWEEADIDLYVSFDSGLTNLNPTAIANAFTSRNRGGTEAIVFRNAVPGRKYYIGVKSEDQQAASFGLFGFAGSTPFSQRDTNGNVIVNGLGVPVDIPDGSSEEASGALVFAYCLEQIKIRNVVVTNTLTHENGGDLFGLLTHSRSNSVLNNHRAFQGTNITFIWDDSDSGEILASIPTDPPGSLRNFWGQEGQGAWQLLMVDDSLVSTGRIEGLTIRLEPAQETNSTNITITILPNRWYYTLADVPPDATLLGIDVAPQGGIVEVYARHQRVPDQNNFDHTATFGPPGGSLEITPADSPPLTPGIWFIGLRNPNSTPLTVGLRIRIERNLTGAQTNIYSSTGPIPLLDDAVTTSLFNVTNAQDIFDVRVGVRIEHERASDLVLTLVSPGGTRILLAENRGRDSTLGYGATVNGTNIYTVFTDNTNLTQTPIKFATPPFTNQICTTVVGTGPQVFFDGFENATCQPVYVAGSVVSGWLVESNDVDITCHGNGFYGLPHSGAQALDLNGFYPGWISQSFATTPGQTYVLSHVYCRNPFTTLPDFVATCDVFIDDQLVKSLSYGNYNSTNQGNLNWFTNQVVFTAVSNTTQLDFRSTTTTIAPPCGTPCGGMYLDSVQVNEAVMGPGGCPCGPTTGGPAGVTILDNGFDGVGCNFTLNAGSYLTGWFIEQGGIDVGCAGAHTGTRWIDLNSCAMGIIRTNLTTVPNTDYQLTFAYAKNPQTGNPNFVATCDVEIGGQVVRNITYALPNSIPNFNWQTTSIVFRATSASTSLRMISTVSGCGGMYLDSFRVVSLGGPAAGNSICNYFFPEEPLSLLRGENAYGTWRLEIWDNRVGAPLNANLVSWYVEFDLVNTNPPVTLITNSQCITGVIETNEVARFAVKAPFVATVVTNFLTSVDNTIIYGNTAVPATGSRPPDEYEGPAGTYSELFMSTNTVPRLRPGLTYYLAIKNEDPTVASNRFTLCINFDRDDTNNLSSIVAITNGQCITTNIAVTNLLTYYQFDASSNAIEVIFDITNNTDNVDMVVSKGLPLPNPTSFYRQSAQPGNMPDNITVTDYSFNFIPGRWYIGVYNSTNVPVTYTICAHEVLGEQFVDLTQVMCTNGARIAAGGVQYFQFAVSPLALRTHFTVSNPDGNVDMYIKPFPPRPPPGEADYLVAGTNPSTLDEFVPLSMASNPQLSPGTTYYIAITNRDPFVVTYNLCIFQFLGYVPLANGVCLTNTIAHPNDAHYYKFTILSNSMRADFLTLYSDGDIDLYLSQFPVPGPMMFDYESAQVGIGDEFISVTVTNQPIPLAPGDWYAAVVLRQSGSVIYCIKAVQYPVLDPFNIRLNITNGYPTHMDLGWNAFEFQRFNLEWTPHLHTPIPWQPFTNAIGDPLEIGPVGGMGTNFWYRDEPLPPAPAMRFYRLRVLP